MVNFQETGRPRPVEREGPAERNNAVSIFARGKAEAKDEEVLSESSGESTLRLQVFALIRGCKIIAKRY